MPLVTSNSTLSNIREVDDGPIDRPTPNINTNWNSTVNTPRDYDRPPAGEFNKFNFPPSSPHNIKTNWNSTVNTPRDFDVPPSGEFNKFDLPQGGGDTPNINTNWNSTIPTIRDFDIPSTGEFNKFDLPQGGGDDTISPPSFTRITNPRGLFADNRNVNIGRQINIGQNNISTNLNRSSRLIDIGGTPIGQLSVTRPSEPQVRIARGTSDYGLPEDTIRTSLTDRANFPVPEILRKDPISIPAAASQLLNLHEEDGFLDYYYSQVFSKGSLGIRRETQGTKNVLGFSKVLSPSLKSFNSIGRNINRALNKISSIKFNFNTDTRLSFDVANDRREPFIIRGIGQRWGIDRISKPNASFGNTSVGLIQIDRASYKGKDLLRSFTNTIDDVGKKLLGRQPSVFVDRYFADIKRINAATNSLDFLVRGSTYVNAQAQLQKKNTYDTVATTMYAISAEQTADISVDTFLPDKFRGIPIKGQIADFKKGATFNLNPQFYNPLSVFSVPGVLGINRAGFVDVSTIASRGTLVDTITEKTLSFVAQKATEYIISPMVKRIQTKLDKTNIVKKAKKVRKDVVDVIKGVKKLNEKIQKTADFFSLLPPQQGVASKAGARKILQSLPGYSEKGDTRGVDKVNLIPYGSDVYGKKGEEVSFVDMDWIPFKFRDVRKSANDPNNNGSIVFRAILSGITDTFSPEYASERYVGRPDAVYVYQGTNREISFTFDVYPKSQEELPRLWEKLNYLAGMTYPHFADGGADGGGGMISPLCELTIGQMYTDSPGYISALTYTVQDNGTWETDFAQLPKYVQVQCTFVYLGRRLPTATQKHYECPWIGDEVYSRGLSNKFLELLRTKEVAGYRNAEKLGPTTTVYSDRYKQSVTLQDIAKFSTRDLKKLELF